MTTLLVASSGGHLKQLHLLRVMLPDSGPYKWVTFDTPQSRSLLEHEDVRYVEVIHNRDWRGALRAIPQARAVLDDHRDISAVCSTGAAIALPYLLAARSKRMTARYVESAARTQGPSLTGRILQRVPGVQRHTQYRRWSSGTWSYIGSVFDAFEPVRREPPASGRRLRVVVTTGTLSFRFDRLVTAVRRAVPAGSEILWQSGGTRVEPRDGEKVERTMPAADLLTAMKVADLVIAHSGVGSALTALEAGRCPVLVPRRARSGEHIDDHQELIAEELQSRGLALLCEADELETTHLEQALTKAVRGRSL